LPRSLPIISNGPAQSWYRSSDQLIDRFSEPDLSRPQPRRPAKSPTIRKHLGRLSRTQAIFSILAVVVVCSLVVTTLGAAVYDGLRGSGSDDASSLTANSTGDPVLEQMRADAQASPNDPETLAALANYLANTGNTDEAIIWYEKATALTPNDADLRLDFGIALTKGEKYKDAEVQLKKAIDLTPNYAQAYLSLGELYLNWIPPRDADAITAFNKAIAIDPTSVVAQRAQEDLSRIVGASPAASPGATP
jgi:tetratricopeptide (TPR) repeat protein